jgi:mRNA interferase MazF
MAVSASCGDVVLADLNPVRGHEQAGTRPALVISIDPFNRGPAGLVIVVPITTKDKRIASHLAIEPPEGGLKHRSYAMPEAIRSISRERLVKRFGAVTSETIATVRDQIRILIDLP